MGLMDRLRETAQEVAGEARRAGAQAQGKLGEVTLRRKIDEAARQLGLLVHRERTQGTPAGSDADALVREITQLEQELARRQEETRKATTVGASSTGVSSEGDPMEDTQPGAAPPQSPPEGSPTDQPRS
jgi:hypothetical protein